MIAVISGILSKGISIDHELDLKSPNKGLIISLIVGILMSISMEAFVSWPDGFGPTKR